MREIKFRVWDIQAERYTKARMDFLHLTEAKITPITYNAKLVFEQFTGLCDKNGKEIYEGDIVNVRNAEGWKTATVEYTSGGFCVLDGEYITPLRMYCFDTPELCGIEVIGNIHQNPGLLEVKQ